MFQNIKTDIIYHKTATDFEMEFNLCGCCRMRLLSDKSSDKKIFVHNLARAVSRSKVIIIIGNLFGSEGIMSIVAAAIGKKLTTINNAQYHINSSENIEVIQNSTPLITKDGFFGGCILESGPQTMVLLSDNKNIRKNILQTLIHPYIKELYSAQMQSENAVKDETIQVSEEIEAPKEEPVISFEPTTKPVIKPIIEPIVAVTEPVAEIPVIPTPTPIVEDVQPTPVSETPSEQIEVPEKPAEVTTEAIETEEVAQAKNPLDTHISNQEEIDDSTPDIGDLLIEDDYVPPTEEELLSLNDEFVNKDFENDNDETYSLLNLDDDVSEDNTNYYNSSPDFIDDSYLISDDDDFIDSEYKKLFNLDIPILVISAIVIALLGAIIYLLFFFIPSKSGFSALDYIKNIIQTLFP